MPSSRASNRITSSSSPTITAPFSPAGLPLNAPAPWRRRSPWPDWRDGDPGDLRERLDWPIEGVLFDVEHNALWHPSWGHRPADTSEALRTARQHLSQAPKMIPVCGHRYLPAGRGTYGHPVLSIYQTDIIVYGTDLADYINCEFNRWFRSSVRTGPHRRWCRSGATSSHPNPRVSG